MNVRPASPADLPAILAIAEQTPEAPRWPPSAWSAFLSPRVSSPAASPALVRTCLVAHSEGTLLGFAAASALLDGEENRCELESIAVAPAARRQGVAAALLHEFLRWARSQGVRRLALEVRAANTPALALYQRFGFRTEARRPRYYRDPDDDALLLSRGVTEVPKCADFSTGNLIEGGPPRC